MYRSACLLLLVLATSTVSAQSGGASLTLATTPDPLGLGQNRFDVTVKDARGPVAQADVTLALVMPADPKTKHPEMRTEGKLNNVGAGRYSGVAIVSMAGTWQVTVTAAQAGKPIGHLTKPLVAYATRAAAQSEHKPHTHTHADAAALKNPVPAAAESVSAGSATFAKQCATCHGAAGKGDGVMAAKLKSKPADLTDAEWTHGPSDGEIFTLIRDGARNAGMKGYRGVLTDRQMWDLVNYIRALGPKSSAPR
jgi:mono/diheme cytochrome c family protein